MTHRPVFVDSSPLCVLAGSEPIPSRRNMQSAVCARKPLLCARCGHFMTPPDRRKTGSIARRFRLDRERMHALGEFGAQQIVHHTVPGEKLLPLKLSDTTFTLK